MDAALDHIRRTVPATRMRLSPVTAWLLIAGSRTVPVFIRIVPPIRGRLPLASEQKKISTQTLTARGVGGPVTYRYACVVMAKRQILQVVNADSAIGSFPFADG